jgi:16S rRNA (guanine527-N7)-methyltransferase
MNDIDGVSRETSERLNIYATLLKKWNSRINLVARSTIDSLWTRHFVDSAQVYGLAPSCVTHWVDLGSGGGFPGLIAAILGAERTNGFRTTLIECDARKSAFLRSVIRETAINATVITERIEATPRQNADILSARALADLSTLLSFAELHMNADGRALFPKGENWRRELPDAQSKWQFDYQVDNSKTEIGPVILSVTGVLRA